MSVALTSRHKNDLDIKKHLRKNLHNLCAKVYAVTVY